MNRCIRDGPMVGVKLLVAEHVASRPSTRSSSAPKSSRLPFSSTWLKITGNLPDESTPMQLAELAARHPKATLICGHSGGDWDMGLRAIRPQNRDVYADFCGGDPTSGYTEMAVRQLGAERCLYGSDIGARSFSSQLSKVLGADIPESAKRLILGENLKRLLKPILETKGVKL